MDISNNDNHSVNNENIPPLPSISTPTPPPNRASSSSILTIYSPRRSSRLSSKSPATSSRTPNIHRTLSGGVENNHSPRLNNRNRTPLSGSRVDYSNRPSQTSFNDGSGIHRAINDLTNLDLYLPSDQSDDDEMPTNNNTAVQPNSSALTSRSEILSYFERQNDGFECKLCHKIYRAGKLSDTNLRKHLSSSIHKVPNVLFKSQINDISKIHVTTISSERKRELHDAAISCIVQDGLPFHTFRRPRMSRFLSTAIPGYKGPHRKTVRNRIAVLYSTYTAKLRSILPNVGLLALTSDLWRNSHRQHFISLTAHVFAENYESIPIILGCRRIIGPHLATSIERYIKYELNWVGIKKEQIISITTDNGSNMKKATSSVKFGDGFSCMAHILNLVVKKGLCLWVAPKPDGIQFQTNFNLNEWEDVDDEDEYDDTDECFIRTDDVASDLVSEEDNDSSVSEDDAEVTGTINNHSDDESDVDIQFSSLIIDDNNSSSIDHFKLLNDVFGLMQKTRLAIKYIRNHNITHEYINKHMQSQNGGKKTGVLVLDMKIRWNRSFLLLARFLNHKDILNSMFAFPSNIPGITETQRKRLKDFTFNQHEYELLALLKDVLEPFLIATTALSGQMYPTMAVSFYVYRLLSFYLQARPSDEPIKLALKQSLRFWCNIYLKEKLPPGQMETMMMAAFLDPEVYKELDGNDRKSAKKIIFKKLNNSALRPTTMSPLPSLQATTPPTTKMTPLQKLAAICGRQSATSTTAASTITLDEEISMYVNATLSTNDFQQFWIEHGKQLPRLANLVRRVNIIPATSVSSEALFSVATFFQRKQRSSLSSQTLRYLLVLKNRHLIDKLEQK